MEAVAEDKAVVFGFSSSPSNEKSMKMPTTGT
jgi:hypothetical protein